MRKKVLIAIAVIFALAILAGYWAYSGIKKSIINGFQGDDDSPLSISVEDDTMNHEYPETLIDEPRQIENHPLVPGGVISLVQFKKGLGVDLYRFYIANGFNFDCAEISSMPSTVDATVSFRAGKEIHWSKKKYRVLAGEKVIQDCEGHFIRARCGNLIYFEKTPEQPETFLPPIETILFPPLQYDAMNAPIAAPWDFLATSSPSPVATYPWETPPIWIGGYIPQIPGGNTPPTKTAEPSVFAFLMESFSLFGLFAIYNQYKAYK